MNDNETRLAQGTEIALRHFEMTGQSPSAFDDTDAWWKAVTSWWQVEVNAGRQEWPPQISPKAVEYARELDQLLATR